MKTQNAWKVVRKVDKSLMSAVGGHVSVYYSKYKWTNPPHNGQPFLFVFQTRKDARNFVKQEENSRLRIWRCKVINPRNPSWLPEYLGYWPHGTLFADAVKLVKRS